MPSARASTAMDHHRNRAANWLVPLADAYLAIRQGVSSQARCSHVAERARVRAPEQRSFAGSLQSRFPWRGLFGIRMESLLFIVSLRVRSRLFRNALALSTQVRISVPQRPTKSS